MCNLFHVFIYSCFVELLPAQTRHSKFQVALQEFAQIGTHKYEAQIILRVILHGIFHAEC